MPKFRRKPSAALRDFIAKLDKYVKFDADNQSYFSSKSSTIRISKQQLHFLTESIFFNSFREYENFIRDIFLLYTLEKPHSSGIAVRSYLKPKDFLHAESLIKSSMHFLDWAKPDVVIERSKIYLKDGFPLKLPYTSNLSALIDFKKIRNHIAHNSPESLAEYKKVLRNHFSVIPLKIPTPGEFLLMSKRRSSKYNLQVFFNLIRQIANALV